MTKNIMFVSHSSEMNGAELTLLHLLQDLDRTRFEPILVLPKDGPLGEEAGRAGIEVVIVPFKWWLTEKKNIWKQPLSWMLNRPRIKEIEKIIQRHSVRLVFSNSAAASCGAEAARRCGVPHIWSIHEFLTGENPLLHHFLGEGWLIGRIERLSGRIIVNSRAAAVAFPRSPKVKVIYNGVRLQPEDQAEDLKKELGLGEAPVIGVVGKLYREKGQKEVIRALSGLRKVFPGIRLLIVGGVRDPGYKREMEALVKKLGLRDHVRFLGQRRDGLRLMRIMDLLLVPSRIDTFGLAALDAMSVRTPVLALRAGGLTEILRHEKNGYLIQDLAPSTIERAVILALEDEGFRETVISGGLRTVRERFSVTNQVRDTQQVMEDCLLESRK